MGKFLSAVAGALAIGGTSAQIMSVDLGHEFFKVALMRQSAPLEIVLNTHSKRKTTSAVSFFEDIRVFGDDALAHQGKAPSKVPMFFHSSLGKNYTAEDVKAGGQWWKDFGLDDMFYPYQLSYNEARGVPTFKVGDEDMALEELLAHTFHFAKKMSDETADGKINVKEMAVTIPPTATLRQRQAIVAAGQIAGLRVQTLTHETAAFAVQRAIDYSPEQGSVEHALYYNVGSRKTEVAIVKLEARSAGMVKGKTAPVVTVLGSAIDHRMGGHLMDIRIAKAMLEKFKAKYPNFADGISKNSRALRKLLSQAQKTKAILSANKQAPFIVEGLYEDTDFQAQIRREDFEEMCTDMFEVLSVPIETALREANVTMKDINHVEVVGGAWRVPKVNQLLSEYIEKEKGEKIQLGQHLNGEEASALGTALVSANASSSFRVRKIFFGDITQHEYAVQVVAHDGSWEKNYTVLHPKGTALGAKKKISIENSDDFNVRLFENNVLLSEYTVSGVKNMLENEWSSFNLTGPAKISASVSLDTSGLVELKSVFLNIERAYWVNETRPKLIPLPNFTDLFNSTNASDNESADAVDASAEETATSESKSETGNTTANVSQDDNSTDHNASFDMPKIEYETVQKLKKKKHEKKLNVSRKDFLPLPLTDAEISALKEKLKTKADAETEVLAVASIKNELEAAIYGSRDKMENDEIRQVTTEEQREAVTKLATDIEEWMYEPGSTKSDYEAKLQALDNHISPMQERAREYEARAMFEENVKDSMDVWKKNRAQIEKKMPWVNATKVEAAVKKQESFEEWWSKKHDAQTALPLHEAPAYMVDEARQELSKIDKEWDKLLKIKKPVEKKPAASKNNTNTSKASGKSPPPAKEMPADVAATQKELKEIGERKHAAVEKEDFDTAEKLKKEEKALKAHLEKLQAGSKTEL